MSPEKKISKTVNQLDREFLETHDFDRDVEYPECSDDPDSVRLRVENFLYNHPGLQFNYKELEAALNIGHDSALLALANSNLVKPVRTGKDGRVNSWLVTAQPLEPTAAGLIEEALQLWRAKEDPLGIQAKEDFTWTQKRGRHRRATSQG